MSTTDEGRRKLVHMAMLGFAFLLRPLIWWQAALMALLAVLYNGLVFRRLHGDAIFREAERASGVPRGLIYYPLSILILILVVRAELVVVGAAWAVLALGDGMATVLGQRWGRARLPWNRHKSWAGTIGFAVFGSMGAFGLGLYLRGATHDGVELTLAVVAVAAALTGVLTAVLESVPLGIDDNLVVPFGAAAVFWLAVRTDVAVLTAPDFWIRCGVGVAVAAMTGAVAWMAGSVDGAGWIGGVGIGAGVWIGAGAAGFATLLTFFVLGVGATRVGYQHKLSRGLAEGRGGRRTWIHALANGLAGAAACLAAALVPELRGPLLLGFVAAFATAGADTVSSEIGKRFGRRAYLPTSLQRVPPGTEGAISVEGTCAGIAAAAVIAGVAFGLGLGSAGLAAAAVAGAVGGNYLESLAGHLLGAADELANEVLNFFNTVAGAVLAVGFASALGLL